MRGGENVVRVAGDWRRPAKRARGFVRQITPRGTFLWLKNRVLNVLPTGIGRKSCNKAVIGSRRQPQGRRCNTLKYRALCRSGMLRRGGKRAMGGLVRLPRSGRAKCSPYN